MRRSVIHRVGQPSNFVPIHLLAQLALDARFHESPLSTVWRSKARDQTSYKNSSGLPETPKNRLTRVA
jgi:hypothetical protein